MPTFTRQTQHIRIENGRPRIVSPSQDDKATHIRLAMPGGSVIDTVIPNGPKRIDAITAIEHKIASICKAKWNRRGHVHVTQSYDQSRSLPYVWHTVASLDSGKLADVWSVNKTTGRADIVKAVESLTRPPTGNAPNVDTSTVYNLPPSKHPLPPRMVMSTYGTPAPIPYVKCDEAHLFDDVKKLRRK